MNKIKPYLEKLNKIEKLKYLIKQKGDCKFISCKNCPLLTHTSSMCSSMVAKEMLKKEIKKELMGKINE